MSDGRRSSSRTTRIASAFLYGLLVFLGTAGLGFVVLPALGLATGLALQIWTSAFSWPLNVGGKPFVSMPAFVPVVFELVVLFAGLASVAAFLLRGGRSGLKPDLADRLPRAEH